MTPVTRRPAVRPHMRPTTASGRQVQVVPFDHAAAFQLTGRPGNVIEDIINITPDGSFVAVAIGYGLDEDRARPFAPRLTAAQLAASTLPPGALTLGQIPEQALIDGFRINPAYAPVVLSGGPGFGADAIATERYAVVQRAVLVPPTRNAVLERLVRTPDISFLFSMVDTSTGRELQDVPAHNLATLGISNGERPFRPLAQPLGFLPRSSLRMQIIEGTEDVRGTLNIVLYGYMAIGLTNCPEPTAREVVAAAQRAGHGITRSRRAIPFDHVATLQLEGTPGRTTEREINVSTEGRFVATAIGYGLATTTTTVRLGAASLANPNTGRVALDQVPLDTMNPRDLLDGVRVRPALRRLVFADGGGLAQVFPDLLDELFEPLNTPESVSFQYSFFDGSVGRELQNEPIHNVAGLGSADGKRPFKRLIRPLAFLPRAVMRVRVTERYGRGDLHIAFHGYQQFGDPV
ncbi:MAG: hypothetical protein ACREMA_00880 [Longimicrobiales bacterium]